MFSVRTLFVTLLAAGLIFIPADAFPSHAQAVGKSGSRSTNAKREKHFSYLSINMGVQFSYPAEYKFAPSPPPKGLSEAAYHWVPAAAHAVPGMPGTAYRYRYSVQMINFGFTTAAGALGYLLKGGKWTHPEIRGGHFESVKSIRGNDWQGLIATFRGRLYSVSGKGRGMAQGTTIIAGDNKESSVLLNFFPDRGAGPLRRAILQSIKFISPRPTVGKARKLFRNEKLGVEFQYPASYKLTVVKPFSPPGAASDSLPVEAAYELNPSLPPCCAGVGNFAFSYQYYIFVLKLDFLSAAKSLGFAKSAKGKWVYKDDGELNKARPIAGNGWCGLRMVYNFRLYRAASALQRAQGLTSVSGYLGASEGEKTLLSAGGNRSIVLEFDPQQNDLRNVIIKSLRFLKPPFNSGPGK